MAKYAPDSFYDNGLLGVKNSVTTEYLCVGQPVSRADAISKAVANTAVGAADVTVQAGQVSGRRMTVAAKAGVTASGSGLADHLALTDGANLLYVTTCTQQQVTSGNPVNFPTWNAELRAPA